VLKTRKTRQKVQREGTAAQAVQLPGQAEQLQMVQREGTAAQAVQDGEPAPERPLPGQAKQLQMVQVKIGRQCWMCKVPVPMKVVRGRLGMFWVCSNWPINGCRAKAIYNPEEGDGATSVPLAAPAGEAQSPRTKFSSPDFHHFLFHVAMRQPEVPEPGASLVLVDQAASGRGTANVNQELPPPAAPAGGVAMRQPEERVTDACKVPLASLA
jgi:hypothetical protein